MNDVTTTHAHLLYADSAHWLAKGGWHNADLYRKIVLKITDISTIILILKTH